jgi:hypothetical protein
MMNEVYPILHTKKRGLPQGLPLLEMQTLENFKNG